MSQIRIIRPARNVLGSVRMPGDKSISHRYAMLAALAQGATRLHNYATGADCASTLRCVEALGAGVAREDGAVVVAGLGGALQEPGAPLDCGNSGSTMRMLSGILAAQPFRSELVGDASLSRRPMARIRTPLERMGARVELTDGHAPVRIEGARLHGVEYATPVASAQVKTSILFAGVQAHGTTAVEEPVRTRDHGELALRAFGARLQRGRTRASIEGPQTLQAIEATVPGDISSAAFFLCAAALFPDSNLVVDGLGMNPTRSALLDVLAGMGARLSVLNLEEHHGELVGTVRLAAGPLAGAELRGARSAQLIDEVPVLAAIAPYTEGGVLVRDAKELRVKESDRIATVAANLRRMGARAEEFEDGLWVPGGQRLHGAEIETAHDHRIAMAFAVAALRAEGETVIHDAEAADVSFPEFFEMLEGVVER